MTQEATKTVTLRKVQKISWLYFLGITTQMIANTMINAYVSFYVTERMLISATIMALVLTISRICDIVVGTLAGVIVQKTQGRFGQYRTLLLYAPLAVHGGSILCFINPNVPIGVKMVFVFIGYLAYGIGMSFVQLGQNGLIPRIAGLEGDEGKNRVTISSRITQGQNVARLISGVIIVPCITFFDGLGTDGYTVVTVLFAVIALIGQGFLFFGVREVDKYDPEFKANNKASRTHPIKIIIGAFKNPVLGVLLVSDVLRFTVMQLIGQLGAYYFTYVAGDFSMLGINTTVAGFCSAGAAFIMPPISKKLGRRSSAIISGIVMACAMFYLGFLSDGSGVSFIIANGITQAAFVLLACNGPNLYIDAGEVQYYETGVDNRTFATSVFGIASKFSWLFVGVGLAAILNACGYDQVEKTVANVDLMHKLTGLVPCACFALFTILMAVGYRINKDKVAKAYEANKQKDAEAKAAANN